MHFLTETKPLVNSVNIAVYELLTKAPSPVSLAAMKDYLKITTSDDDAIIQTRIDAATEWGEKITGRDFRAITWKLLLDCFADRIELCRDPVISITTVKHLVDAVLVTVPDTVYYLKKLPESSEILLNEDQEWPTDTDNREQAIEIEFATTGFRCQDTIIEAIQRHVAQWYFNRGDCADMAVSAKMAGVLDNYAPFTIQRI